MTYRLEMTCHVFTFGYVTPRAPRSSEWAKKEYGVAHRFEWCDEMNARKDWNSQFEQAKPALFPGRAGEPQRRCKPSFEL